MELAIPILALGGLYVISNQDSTKKKITNSQQLTENYENMGQKQNYLPNVEIPPSNYPIINTSELVNTVQNYPNPNTATDKYFNQTNYENSQNAGINVGNQIQDVYSLTGNYVDTSNFKHNNMVPFYGGKIKGQVYGIDKSESILDNMVGSGSQNIQKIEQAPLFKPQEHMQWANGAPNMSDFYQSRVNPAMKNSNTKPFESEYVGPGLNHGYGKEGSGGFNSGMESRDSWLPKTVDELRVNTNPKIEYSLENHQGPAMSSVTNLGIEGKIEKYRPDTFFIQTQDRWLTTTGQEIAQTLRPIQEDRDTSRAVLTQPYSGVASHAENGTRYVTGEYEDPKRAVLGVSDIGPSSAMNRGSHEDKDRFVKSHTNYVNNRASVRQPDTFRSGFGGAIGAVIAPIMDMFRPTRKEEFSDSIRVYGDAGTTVPQSYILNPGDTPTITVKETTMFSPNSYIGNQTNAAYTVAEQQAIANQRDTTNCSSIGSAGGAASRYGDMNYGAAYNQHNNDIKSSTNIGRTNQGNTQIFNQTMNVSMSKHDSDRDNNRQWAPSTMGFVQMAPEMYGRVRGHQAYDENKIGCDRIQPDLLNAFKANPYTHSLTDSV